MFLRLIDVNVRPYSKTDLGISLHMHTHICGYVYASAYVYVYMYAYMHLYIHIYIYMHGYTYLFKAAPFHLAWPPGTLQSSTRHDREANAKDTASFCMGMSNGAKRNLNSTPLARSLRARRSGLLNLVWDSVLFLLVALYPTSQTKLRRRDEGTAKEGARPPEPEP